MFIEHNIMKHFHSFNRSKPNNSKMIPLKKYKSAKIQNSIIFLI